MHGSTLDTSAITFARDNLGETDEVARESVQQIKTILKDNPHINARNDELSILFFLRSCKFNVDQTQKRITNFYKQRAERIEWFSYRDPFLTELSELLALGVFLPLRQKDAENRQIVIIRTAAHNPSRNKQNDVFKIGRMILDYLVSTDESMSVYGIRAIFDMQGISLGHALQMTPLIIKRAVDSWESYPLRIQKLEFVNANYGINFVLDIFRSFMSAKMKARVSVKRGKPEFKASDNLPVELGGNESSYASLAEHWKRVLENNSQWFVDDEPFKSLI